MSVSVSAKSDPSTQDSTTAPHKGKTGKQSRQEATVACPEASLNSGKRDSDGCIAIPTSIRRRACAHPTALRNTSAIISLHSLHYLADDVHPSWTAAKAYYTLSVAGRLFAGCCTPLYARGFELRGHARVGLIGGPIKFIPTGLPWSYLYLRTPSP